MLDPSAWNVNALGRGIGVLMLAFNSFAPNTHCPEKNKVSNSGLGKDEILLAIVWKVAVAAVLIPLPVIALAIADFPLLTEDFKELISVAALH